MDKVVKDIVAAIAAIVKKTVEDSKSLVEKCIELDDSVDTKAVEFTISGDLGRKTLVKLQNILSNTADKRSLMSHCAYLRTRERGIEQVCMFSFQSLYQIKKDLYKPSLL